MSADALSSTLAKLIEQWEQETIEFKQADNNYSTNDIGKYFSALANEANLCETDRAWLVFGVNNKSRTVAGTHYRENAEQLMSIKQQIAESTEPGISFRGVHELETDLGRVIMFEIPAAPRGIPIAWKGHYYARNGESLSPLGLAKLDEIRGQTLQTDWSAQVIPTAKLDALDPAALARARESYALKYANRFKPGEVESWTDETFLDRAKLTINGQLTRTAILLLGRAESAHYVSPQPAQITWKLEGAERAYQHFGPPFLLNTSALYQKIRNIQLRILPEDELLAIEVAKYDQKIVLEALHNCIAHQDYPLNARVLVTEFPEQLVFENLGSFFAGQPKDYLKGTVTPHRYRNPFLAQAMSELGMIDTMGYGIHEMTTGQARRYFPLPDYEISRHPESVKLTLLGKIVDPAYSRVLIKNADLPLDDIFALDRVQKSLPISDSTAKHLRKDKLIEGRKPNYHISVEVAKTTKQKAKYIKTRGLDDAYYKKLILDFLEKFGSASRTDIDDLLTDKLSDILNEKQKYNKIKNLLSAMRQKQLIHTKGSKHTATWHLSE